MSAASHFFAPIVGQVSPITLNIGTNDVNDLRILCGDDIAAPRDGPAVLNTISTNLHLILSQLRAASPDAEIITFTDYNVAALVDARSFTTHRGVECCDHGDSG